MRVASETPPVMDTGLHIIDQQQQGMRWNSDSKDGRFLQSLIESGHVEGMSGNQISAVYPRFKRYDKNAFSTNVRRLKKRIADQRGNRIVQDRKCLLLFNLLFDPFDCCTFTNKRLSASPILSSTSNTRDRQPNGVNPTR